MKHNHATMLITFVLATGLYGATHAESDDKGMLNKITPPSWSEDGFNFYVTTGTAWGQK